MMEKYTAFLYLWCSFFVFYFGNHSYSHLIISYASCVQVKIEMSYVSPEAKMWNFICIHHFIFKWIFSSPLKALLIICNHNFKKWEIFFCSLPKNVHWKKVHKKSANIHDTMRNSFLSISMHKLYQRRLGTLTEFFEMLFP